MAFSLNDFAVGDVLKFTERSKRAGAVVEEHRTAIVVSLDYNGNGLVGVQGCYVSDDLLPTGAGSFDPAKVGTKPFGFYCAIEKIGHRKPYSSFWTPAPGNLAYDLMC